MVLARRKNITPLPESRVAPPAPPATPVRKPLVFAPPAPGDANAVSRAPADRALAPSRNDERVTPDRAARTASDPGNKIAQPTELAAAVARNLVLARFALDVTQDRLATASQVSRATIAQIESGNSDTRLGTLAELARALGVSPSLLLLRPADLTSLLHFVRRSAIDRVLSKLSTQQLKLMNELRQTGFQKDLLRAAQLGIDAAGHAGFKTPGAVVGAGIGSAIQPGVGTAVGAVLGVALDASSQAPAELEEGAGI